MGKLSDIHGVFWQDNAVYQHYKKIVRNKYNNSYKEREVIMSETILEYYRKQGISTEHGVDEDWDKHIKRRKKLYRQLGIPVLAIKGSSILEIGPGGGGTIPFRCLQNGKLRM